LIQGYAVIAIDVRGQGETGDYSHYSSDALGSWVTKGILDNEEYYYRKVYMDGVRVIDFACSRDEIDPERIGLMGASMGGGITLAVAALDDRPKLAVADIPNMCDLGLAIQQKFEGSLTFVESFLHRYPKKIERVYETLSYFDNLNLVQKISCRTRMSVGLKDLICPPQPIFGVYNHVKAPKSLEVYPFSGHDVSMVSHIDKTIAYVNQHL
jgi:cephalosporin-C deacetylase